MSVPGAHLLLLLRPSCSRRQPQGPTGGLYGRRHDVSLECNCAERFCVRRLQQEGTRARILSCLWSVELTKTRVFLFCSVKHLTREPHVQTLHNNYRYCAGCDFRVSTLHCMHSVRRARGFFIDIEGQTTRMRSRRIFWGKYFLISFYSNECLQCLYQYGVRSVSFFLSFSEKGHDDTIHVQLHSRM